MKYEDPSQLVTGKGIMKAVALSLSRGRYMGLEMCTWVEQKEHIPGYFLQTPTCQKVSSLMDGQTGAIQAVQSKKTLISLFLSPQIQRPLVLYFHMQLKRA